MNQVGASRALGGLLVVACAAVAILHIWFGYGVSDFSAGWPHAAGGMSLAFALPITVGVLAVCGLGLWLGWIMATTKPAAPITPPPMMEKPVKKPVAKRKPRKRATRARKTR